MLRFVSLPPAPIAVILGTTTALVLSLSLTWGADNSSRSGSVDPPNADLSISIDTSGDTIADCGTGAGQSTTCQLMPPSEFTVVASVNSLAGLTDWDDDGKTGYVGAQVRLTVSDGLVIKGATQVWPGCALPAIDSGGLPSTLLAGCTGGIGANESTFIGPIVEFDINCLGGGRQQVEMVHGVPLDSYLVNDLQVEVSDKGTDRLRINCWWQSTHTFENTTTAAASGLHLSSSPHANLFELKAPADCPEPTLWLGFDKTIVDWGVPCVEPGEKVTVSMFSDGAFGFHGTWIFTHQDSDADGCSDAEELGSTPSRGGQRDPTDFWDFFDTDTENGLGSGTRLGGVISVTDIFSVVVHVGQTGDPAIDPLSDASNPASYHTRFDRGGATDGGRVWTQEPPDGSITVGDVFAVVAQFGHSCFAPPKIHYLQASLSSAEYP